MNKKKKLVIKVNYDSGDKLLTDEQLNLEMTGGWDIKRIGIALLISISVLVTGLYYLFFKSSSPIIDTPVPNLITHAQEKETEPQIIHLEERVQEVISEQLVLEKQISEQSDVDKKDTKVFDAIEDNIVTDQAIHSEQVVRSQLTNRVIENEPIDVISSPILVEKDSTRRLYYFTEIKDMSGKTIYHDWIYQGNSVFRKKVNIKGNRWRVATQKKLNNTLLGDWKVTLTDSNGQLLREIEFEVIEK